MTAAAGKAGSDSTGCTASPPFFDPAAIRQLGSREALTVSGAGRRHGPSTRPYQKV